MERSSNMKKLVIVLSLCLAALSTQYVFTYCEKDRYLISLKALYLKVVKCPDLECNKMVDKAYKEVMNNRLCNKIGL